MYCIQCGAQLNNDARFCTKCGAPVDADESKPATTVDTTSATAAPVSANVPAGGGDSSASTNGVPTPSVANVPEPVGSSAAAAAAPVTAHAAQAPQEGVTFAEAMDSTRRKGRRKMPLIVLVALITLLLSATAFAAYYVYTNFIAPQAEQTQEAPVAEQPAETTPEQEPDTNAENAATAYEGIVEEFRFVAQSIAERGDTSGISPNTQSTEVLLDGTSADFGAIVSLNSGEGKLCPHVSSFAFMDPDMGPLLAQTQYALKDINGDNVPELFVGGNAGEGTSPIIMQVFSYQEGAVKPLLVHEVYREMIGLCEGGYIQTWFATAIYGGSSVYALQNGSLACIASWSWDPVELDGDMQDSTPYKISVTRDGSTEESTIPYSELKLFRDQMNSQYPPDTTLEWIAI